MNLILKDIIKWLVIYITAVTLFGMLLVWYMPKLIEALWIASGLISK